MHTELITIPTNTLPLDGAYYEPTDRAPVGAALIFHGNTMNFYTGAARFLPPVLTSLGLVCLAFNRRGHDILSIRDSRSAEGAAFQLTHEGIEDNRTAAAWLAKRGFSNPVVIGHSNGGMLGIQHVADHPDTPALITLSAHRGGKSSLQEGSKGGLLAGDQFDEILAQAKAAVAAGRPKELMLMPRWWYVITAESFLDRLTQVPDTIALAPRISCPVLAVRGDEESSERYPAEEFAEHCTGPCDVEIVPACDHFYKGNEALVAGVVGRWLQRTLGLAA
jgi:pimeloyl-ACP methyl ester carboxylesterase